MVGVARVITPLGYILRVIVDTVHATGITSGYQGRDKKSLPCPFVEIQID
jgi:hypothetical protein